MKRLLATLATLAIAATPTLAGLGATSGGLTYQEQARCRGSACPVPASLTIILPRSSRISIFSANDYRHQKTIDGAGDTLPRYALRTGANAVFSAGLLDTRFTVAPQGGLQIDGQQIARFNRNWISSSLICIESNGDVSFTPLRDESNVTRINTGAFVKFRSARTCLQSGDTLLTRRHSAQLLARHKDAVLPNDYWNIRQDRQIIVQFDSKAVGFLRVPNATRADVVRLLGALTDTVGAPVIYAVNLNGGRQSGYIVRTREDPAIVGNMVFSFPAVFLVH